MIGAFQVAHNYSDMRASTGWEYFAVGPLRGDGWLAAVGLSYDARTTGEHAWSITLVSGSEASATAHAAGVNLLGPGGHRNYPIGRIQARVSYRSYLMGVRDVYPFWHHLDPGSHWISVAYKGLSATYETFCYAWALVVGEEFMAGLMGVHERAVKGPGSVLEVLRGVATRESGAGVG